MNPIKSAYIHSFFDGLGNSIISIFVPVLIQMYLGNFDYVMLYILAYYGMSTLAILTLKKLMFRFPITTLIIHVFPLLLTPVLISIFPFTLTLSIILGLLGGFVHGIYYVTIEKIQTLPRKPINLAKFDACCNLGHFIFALLSAFILGSALDNSLLLSCILAMIAYALSIIPLIFAKKEMSIIIKNSQPQQKLPKNKYFYLMLTFFAFNAVSNTVVTMVLPVYIYMINPDIKMVGLAFGLIFLADIAVDYFARFLRLKNKHILIVSLYLILYSIPIILLMTIPNTNVLLIACSTLTGLGHIMCYICMSGEYLDNIQKCNCMEDGIFKSNVYFDLLRILMVIVYFIYPTMYTIFIYSIICVLVDFVLIFFIMKSRKSFLKTYQNSQDTKETDLLSNKSE